VRQIGPKRLAYPERHIEAGNRLAWYLGRLDAVYGDRARYVHLTRDPDACAASFTRRADFGIMPAWREGVLLGGEAGQTTHDLALDYLDTVQANIALFLRDKFDQKRQEVGAGAPVAYIGQPLALGRVSCPGRDRPPIPWHAV